MDTRFSPTSVWSPLSVYVTLEVSCFHITFVYVVRMSKFTIICICSTKFNYLHPYLLYTWSLLPNKDFPSSRVQILTNQPSMYVKTAHTSSCTARVKHPSKVTTVTGGGLYFDLILLGQCWVGGWVGGSILFTPLLFLFLCLRELKHQSMKDPSERFKLQEYVNKEMKSTGCCRS